ncbi:MAG: hypothetical protein ACLGIR_12600 [Actinomycetes bacterium]
MRRPTLPIACAVAALVALPATAWAAVTAVALSPGDGAVVDAPTDVVVEVRRELVDPEVTRVDLQLSSGGQRVAGTATVALTCLEGQGCSGVQTRSARWGGVTLDPRTASPFRPASQPACNGRYDLDVRTSGPEGGFQRFATIVLSDRRVDTPGSFVADGEPREAELSWTAVPSPDALYRVERRPAGTTTWTQVALLPDDVTRYVDSPVDPGRWDYRVLASRGDGLVDGVGVAPCTDTEPDVTAATASRQVVVAPGPQPSPRPQPTLDPSQPGSPSSPGTPGASPSPGASPEPSPSAGAGGGGSSGGGASVRIAPPPQARRGASGLDAPAIAGPGAAAEREDPGFYGEGTEFSETIDYGDVVEVAGEDGTARAAGRFVERWLPGRGAGFAELVLDRRRLLQPLASGLLLVAVGMHLRRWMREGGL